MSAYKKLVRDTNATPDSRWTNGKFKGFSCGGYRGADGTVRSQRLQTLSEFQRLAEMGANHLRVSCYFDETGVDTWIYNTNADDLAYLDFFIASCASCGMSVVPVFGLIGNYGGITDYWGQVKTKQSVALIFQILAEKYKDNKTVVGFDLFNEQVLTMGYLDAAWNDLASCWVSAIRSKDPNRTVIIEALDYGNPNKFDTYTPIAFDNIVYSAHIYQPMTFTHQGLYAYPMLTQAGGDNLYPGIVQDTFTWNKEHLSTAIYQSLRNFKAKYNVPIWVGEFSCIYYADPDSRYNYIKDHLDLITAEGYNWAFQSQGDYIGWDFRYQKVENQGAVIPVPNNKLENLIRSYL